MPRKTAGTAVDPRNGQRMTFELVQGGQREVPKPPTNLRADIRKLWSAYWEDVVSGVVRPSEEMLVRRWISNWNRYRVLLDVADAQPMVTGSTGQLKEHPAYGLALKIEASIREDEKQLGWGPKNRADLGIALVEGNKSLAEMNAKYGGAEGRVHEGDRDDSDDDPRRDGDPRRTAR